MSEEVSIISIGQDDFDDGIQELVIKLSNGEHITQKREWPSVKYRDGNTDDLHSLLYYCEEFKTLEKLSPADALAVIFKCSKLISGPDLNSVGVALEDFVGGQVQILNQEILHSHWFEVIRADIQHSLWNGGTSEPKEHVFIKGREGVCTVLYDPKEDKYALIDEFRIGAIYDDSAWLTGIPTGGLEEGEDPEAGAKRECIEEAGIEPYYMGHMYSYKASPGFTTHTQHAYYGLFDSTKPIESINGLDSEGEDIRVEIVTGSDLLHLLRGGDFKNGTAVNALNAFLLHHIGEAKSVEVSNEAV